MNNIYFSYGSCKKYNNCKIIFSNKLLEVYHENKQLISNVNRFLNSGSIHWNLEQYKDAIPPDNNIQSYSIDNGFLFYDDLQFQYGHYFLDVFGKLCYFEDIFKTVPTLELLQIRPIIQYENSPFEGISTYTCNFVHESTDLYLSKFKKTVIPIQKNIIYNIKNLYFPIPYYQTTNFPAKFVEFYQHISTSCNNKISYNKVYISRADTKNKPWFHIRHMLNENELISKIKTKSFDVVELMPLSFEEKVSVFKNASEIVQPFGSNCLNLCFCKPNTKCWIILHPKYVEWKHILYAIAKSFHLSLTIIENDIELIENAYPENFHIYKKTFDHPWIFHGIDKLINEVLN